MSLMYGVWHVSKPHIYKFSATLTFSVTILPGTGGVATDCLEMSNVFWTLQTGDKIMTRMCAGKGENCQLFVKTPTQLQLNLT